MPEQTSTSVQTCVAKEPSPHQELLSRISLSLQHLLKTMVGSDISVSLDAENPDDIFFYLDGKLDKRYWVHLSVTKTPKLGFIESPSVDTLEWREKLLKLKEKTPRKARSAGGVKKSSRVREDEGDVV